MPDENYSNYRKGDRIRMTRLGSVSKGTADMWLKKQNSAGAKAARGRKVHWEKVPDGKSGKFFLEIVIDE
jgi:hypothetical protein